MLVVRRVGVVVPEFVVSERGPARADLRSRGGMFPLAVILSCEQDGLPHASASARPLVPLSLQLQTRLRAPQAMNVVSLSCFECPVAVLRAEVLKWSPSGSSDG